MTIFSMQKPFNSGKYINYIRILVDNMQTCYYVADIDNALRK